MKKHVFQYSIPEPCHEDWAVMTPAEKGRFCSSCQKTVIDFSGMADAEVVRRLSEATDTVCGRLLDSQLERDFILYERNQFPVDLRAVLFGVALSLSACSTGYTQGEVAVRTETVKTTQIPDSTALSTEPGIIRVKVTNLKNEPVKGVKVVLYDGNADTLALVLTDAEGRFSFDLSSYTDPWSLLIQPNEKDEYAAKTQLLNTLRPGNENVIFVGSHGKRTQGAVVIRKKEDNSWRQKQIQSKKQ